MSQPLGTFRAISPVLVRLPHLSPPLWIAAIALTAVIAVLPGLWSLAGVVAVAGALLLFVKPELAVYLLTMSVPLGTLLMEADREEGSVAVTPTEAIIALLILGWIARSLARRRLVVALTPLTIPLVAMLLVVALSSFHATNPVLALKESLKWLELAVVYLFIVAEMGTARQILALLLMLLAGALIEALLGIGQFYLGLGPEFFAIGRFMRAYGTFDQPNPYAGYLGMLIPLGVGLLLTRPSPRIRYYALVATGFAVAAVGMSLSRGAWLGIGLGLFSMMLFWSSRSRLLLAAGTLASLPLVALAFLNILPAELSGRLATMLDYFRFVDVTQETVTSQNWAVIERVAHWQAALDMLAAYPVFGVGAGNYPAVYEWFQVQGWDEPLGHAHNFYLNIAAETGLLGLAVYLCFVLTALISPMVWLVRSGRAQRVGSGATGDPRAPGIGASAALRVSKPRSLASSPARPTPFPDNIWRGVMVGALGALVASSMHNMFDSLFVHSMSVQLGMILALAQVSASALCVGRQRP